MESTRVNPIELWRRCIAEKVSIIDLVEQEVLRDTERRAASSLAVVERAPALVQPTPVKVEEPKKPKFESVQQVILSWLDQAAGMSLSLQDLTEFAESDIREHDLSLEGVNSPLIGIVANVLYEHVVNLIFPDNPWAALARPITVRDLKEHLRVNFGSDGFNHIAGIIPAEFVNRWYTLDRKTFTFRDSEGRPLNIEGTKGWYNEEKERIRRRLVDVVQEHVVSNLQRLLGYDSSEIITEQRKLSSELSGLEVRGKCSFDIKTSEKDNTAKVRNKFLKFSLGCHSGRNEEKGIEVRKKTSTLTTVICDSRDVAEVFKTKFREFLVRESLRPGQAELEEGSVEDLSRDERILAIRERLDEISSLFGRRPSINYLGLEGPTFGSYLQLCRLLQGRGVDIRAVIPEYDYRLSNLMRSIVSANIGRVFNEVDVLNGDINDLLLTDFVQDSNLRVSRSNGENKSGEWTLFYESGRGSGRKLTLREYDSLLADIDSSRFDTQDLSRKYGTLEEFVHAASKRAEGKFDVVFLDYLGQRTDKRDQALRRLFRRRLNDKAVLAITFSLNPRYNPGVTPDEVPQFAFEDTIKIIEEEGYEAKKLEEHRYQDTKNEMCTVLWVVDKKIRK
ncbi:MAG: hypothetical protein HYS32_04320 [Candidatus Woesearchaeota archaeon]|nr:MAG: hypothetical protein HYS32_04320 [Candidatus Woesearchaeota archaeon]